MLANEVLDLMEHKILKEIRRARAWANSCPEVYALTHEWLEQFCVGVGFDIAAGNFPTIMADKIGVVRCIDSAEHAANFVNGHRHAGDSLPFLPTGSCDFVVSNYFEAFDNVISTLNEWNRVLKPGGVLAMIMSDAEHEKYNQKMGPLSNHRRLHLFTALTIRRYLERAGFKGITVERHLHTLRVKGIKP
jgi:SAM-dependent methyltransferase